MNKIEITVRVNLIHLKLFFKKNKKNCCSRSREQCELKSINCTGFSKKKMFTSEQCDRGAWLHCSLEITTRSSKMLLLQTCGTPVKVGGSYQVKSYFFRYQTLICVAAGEPYLQPHYQTAS